jgi:hypothetical protein
MKRRLQELDCEAGNIDEKKSWVNILQSFVKENDELNSKLDTLRKEFEKYKTHTKQMIKNPVSI